MTKNQEEMPMAAAQSCAADNVESYLIDYLLDAESFRERYPFVCLEPLGYNRAVIYVPATGQFTGERPEVGYSKIPRCYGLMGEAELEATGVSRVRRSPQLGFRGQGTLIGIIDTGIAVDNPLFLYEDGTSKIAALWDQTGQDGAPPEGYGFGRGWSREEIDWNLRDGTMELPGDENGHGTFLAAVAAGRERGENGFSGVAPDSELLVVKLRQAQPYLRDFYSIEEGVWACQEDDVMLAIRYVVETAADLQRPVSVCLGLGSNLGGHSGQGNLERYISSLSLVPGISFHMAAGNEGISGHHYHGAMDGENVREVAFHVADGETGFVMELWGDGPSVYTVGFLSPGGERVERVQLKFNESRTIRFFPEATVLRLRSFVGETVSGEQVIRMNFRFPAAGMWKLFVHADGEGEQEFDIWLPISNFLKEDTFFPDAATEDTVTSPGDAIYGITYTPFDVATDSLYVRASRGYTRDGRIKPDLAAPGVAVAVPGAGDIKITKSGSSVAAAFGVGIGALLQEWAFVQQNDIALNGQNMRFYLVQGAVRPGAGPYPNRDWGYGIVNAYEAFLALRR